MAEVLNGPAIDGLSLIRTPNACGGLLSATRVFIQQRAPSKKAWNIADQNSKSMLINGIKQYSRMDADINSLLRKFSRRRIRRCSI